MQVLFMALAAFFAAKEALEMGASTEWPETHGVITSSQILRENRKDYGNDSRRTSTYHYAYSVQVQYAYQVNAIAYTGKRIRVRSHTYSLESLAQRELAEYPAGKTIKVYYNPEAPERSVLKRH
ncbi:MAG: DUF3592 domain-containing protein [Gammaproteobacteria bacterium]|nr:DUF3592 domain-containing protein [Gammaproteobacteria bacterium]